MICIDNNHPLLSIIVPTFNHESYVSKALKSILMQKVSFPCEVLVGDDCSTDKTQLVIKEFEKKYPGIFTVFLRKENMFHKDVSNIRDLRLRCKGKYVIMLEGDDFWTSPYKLQTQVDFLEKHLDYIGVTNRCIVVGRDSKTNRESYPECTDTEYTFSHFKRNILPGQTASFMYRNIFVNHPIDLSLIDLRLSPGDRKLAFSLLCNGKIHCFQKIMSAYRHISSGGSSYSANYIPDFHKKIEFLQAFVKYSEKVSNSQALDCSMFLLLKELRYGLLLRRISLAVFLKYWKKSPFPFSVICDLLLCDFRNVFHRLFLPLLCCFALSLISYGFSL